MWNMFQHLLKSKAANLEQNFSASKKRYPKAVHPNCCDVYFTNTALAQITSECLAHSPKETGLVLIGHIDNEKWFVTDAISPGYDKVEHENAYHEVDHLYTNYEFRIRRRIYAKEPTVLGTLHRHPGNMNVFSSVDDEMNRQYELLVGKGNLSYLVTFVDEQPRFWGYYHVGGTYYDVHTHIGDEPFHERGYLQVAGMEQMIQNRQRYQDDMQHVHELVREENGTAEPVSMLAENEMYEHGYRIDRHSLHEDCQSGQKADDSLRNLLPATPASTGSEEISDEDREALLADIRNMNIEIQDNEMPYDMHVLVSESAKAAKRMHICAAIPHDYIGEVFGVQNDGYFYVLQANEDYRENIPSHFNSVGLLVTPELYERISTLSAITEIRGYDWYGTFNNGFWQTATAQHEVMYTTEFPFTASTSRNLGIIESTALKEKLFVAIGVGSMCSYMVMHAVKCGFDRFILADPDRLEIHNLSRHWLGSRNLGKLKVDAMREQILQVNPFAKIITFPGRIEDMPLSDDMRHFAAQGGVVVSGGDNRAADRFGNELAKELNLAFVSTGCFERAAAGEVFEWIPEANLPLYGEVFEGMIDDERLEGHRAYMGNEQQEMNFVPGIWVDICEVSNLAFKIALELVLRHDPHYTPKLIGDLTNYTLICNTNRTDCGCAIAEKFPEPLMHTTRKRGGIWLNEKGAATKVKIDFDK